MRTRGQRMSWQLDARRQRHFRLSTKLASMSDAELLSRLTRVKASQGWGQNQVLTVDRQKVFVKRVAVTDRELGG